jgi:hypothetical protein
MNNLIPNRTTAGGTVVETDAEQIQVERHLEYTVEGKAASTKGNPSEGLEIPPVSASRKNRPNLTPFPE